MKHFALTHYRSQEPQYRACVVGQHLEVPWVPRRRAVLAGGEAVACGSRVYGARVDAHMVLSRGHVFPELQLHIGCRGRLSLREPHGHRVPRHTEESIQRHASTLGATDSISAQEKHTVLYARTLAAFRSSPLLNFKPPLFYPRSYWEEICAVQLYYTTFLVFSRWQKVLKIINTQKCKFQFAWYLSNLFWYLSNLFLIRHKSQQSPFLLLKGSIGYYIFYFVVCFNFNRSSTAIKKAKLVT